MSFIRKSLNFCKQFPSVVVVILFSLVVAEIHLNLARYNRDDVFKWDVVGYYSYLPATFIDKDLRLSFITPQNHDDLLGTHYGFVDDAEGHHIIKYPMGMSVLLSPFFLTAHVLAEPLGYEANGFSGIYQLMAEFSGLVYLIIGLLFLRKLLLKFYNEKVTALSLLFVLFATNLFYYATIEPVMSHAYSFSLYAVFLYYVYRFYEQANYKHALLAGFTFGLLLLLRPVNFIFALPMVLYKVENLSHLKERFNFIKQHLKYFLAFALLAFVIILPQFFYYHYVTGKFFVFSYGKERFFFNHPHVLEVLVGFRKGWLIYTPLMFFVLAQLFKDKLSGFRTSILFILPLSIYLVSSWWCWWYGGSFGQRTLIDLYPLLVFPLAHFIHQLQDISKLKKTLAYAGLYFCLLLNLFQTAQCKYNIIDFDGMTFKEYVQVFGSLEPSDIRQDFLDKPDYEKAVRGE